MKHLIYKSIGRRSGVFIITALALVAGCCFWYSEFLSEFLIGKRSTEVGQMINATILTLFAVGTIRILYLVLDYSKEEKALLEFYQSLARGSENPFHGGSGESSIIGRRYLTIQTLADQHANIDQEALAALLQMEELAKSSLLKFVGNIFILIGMLGTIVSLAISLLGASDLLEAMTNVMDMGIVISGMSTALSTTMIGIIAYVLFRFFLSQLDAVQSNLLFSVERVTALTLIPKMQPSPESLVPKVMSLVGNLNKLISEMTQNQQQISKSSEVMEANIKRYSETMEGIEKGFDNINQTLSKGFRL